MLNLFNSSYKPRMVVTIYQEQSPYGMNHEYYMESANVESHEGDFVLGVAKPFKVDTLKSLGQFLNENHNAKLSFDGMIPSNVIKAESGTGDVSLVWYVKASERELRFTDKLNIKSGKANVPTLIFKYHNKSVEVFALSSSRRPNENTAIYRAPFHNVGNEGSLCRGSAKYKQKHTDSYNEIMTDVENVFFNSLFSEIHGKPVEGNLNTLWRKQIKGSSKFPSKALIKTSKTLKNIIQ